MLLNTCVYMENKQKIRTAALRRRTSGYANTTPTLHDPKGQYVNF